MVREVQQRDAHLLEGVGLAAEFFGASDRDLLDLGAGPLPIGPEREEGADILDREAEVACIGDEPQPRHVIQAIIAVTAVPAGWRRHQPDSLIVADHAPRDAAMRGCLADVHPIRSFTPARTSSQLIG